MVSCGIYWTTEYPVRPELQGKSVVFGNHGPAKSVAEQTRRLPRLAYHLDYKADCLFHNLFRCCPSSQLFTSPYIGICCPHSDDETHNWCPMKGKWKTFCQESIRHNCRKNRHKAGHKASIDSALTMCLWNKDDAYRSTKQMSCFIKVPLDSKTLQKRDYQSRSRILCMFTSANFMRRRWVVILRCCTARNPADRQKTRSITRRVKNDHSTIKPESVVCMHQ